MATTNKKATLHWSISEIFTTRKAAERWVSRESRRLSVNPMVHVVKHNIKPVEIGNNITKYLATVHYG